MSTLPELSFSNAYKVHHKWLFGWLYKKLGCPHNAADLTQDAFIRVLLKHDRLKDLDTPRAYLVKIAKGLIIDQWRRQELEQRYLEKLRLHGDHTAASQELQAMVIETLFEIDAMLNRLNPKAKQAFLLAQIDGLTYQEIASQLGVSDRMVKKYMTTAMMHCILLKREFSASHP